MKMINGPAFLLAQFAGDEALFNSWDSSKHRAADLGCLTEKVRSRVSRLIDLAKATKPQDCCDGLLGKARASGIEVTELSASLGDSLSPRTRRNRSPNRIHSCRAGVSTTNLKSIDACIRPSAKNASLVKL